MKFEEWLSQQDGVIEVDCGCVTAEAFYHWMRVAYEAGNSPVIPDGYVMVPNDGLIAELLTIAKEAADDADVFAYSEFNNKSMRHTTAIADWESRAAMLNQEQEPATYNTAPQPAVVSDEMIDTFEAEFRSAFKVSHEVKQLIEIGYQGDKFSLSIRDAATWWKLGRAAMLAAAPQEVK